MSLVEGLQAQRQQLLLLQLKMYGEVHGSKPYLYQPTMIFQH
jgi:hypothetical protein